MPEYLAPGVFVEEVDRGSKAIEGVSTSTAAMVGVTERGPVNRPIFLSSFAEYRRWFGGHLKPVAGQASQWYLPSAVEGFFSNGGKRLFVTRVVGANDVASSSSVYAPIGDEMFLLGTPEQQQQPLSSPPQWLIPVINVASSVANDSLLQLGVEAPVYAKYGKQSSKKVFLGKNIGVSASNRHCVKQPVEVIVKSVDSNNKSVTVEPTTDSFGPNCYAIFDQKVRRVTNWVASSYTITLNEAFDSEVRVGARIAIAERSFDDSKEPVLTNLTNVTDFVYVETTEDVASVDGFVIETSSSTQSLTYIERLRLFSVSAKSADGMLFDCWREQGSFASCSVSNRNWISVSGIPVSIKNGDVLLVRTAGSGANVKTQAVEVREISGNVAKVTTNEELGDSVDVCKAERLAPKQVFFHTDSSESGRKVVLGLYSVSESRVYAANPAEPGFLIEATPLEPAVLEVTKVDASENLNVPRGSPIRPVEAVFTVRALDSGDWGNRLRVRAEVPKQRLVRTTVKSGSAGTYELSSLNGIEVGTWLQDTNSTGNEGIFRVKGILKGSVVLESDPAWNQDTIIQSVEFNLSVALLSSAVDGEKAQVSEQFMALTLDEEHSRYVPKVVGSTVKANSSPEVDQFDNPVRRSDGRPRGESQLIRVEDFGLQASTLLVPQSSTIRDKATGRIVPVWTSLSGGVSDKVTATDVIGTDSIEPAQRTGLFTLRNEDDISLVACPGWTDQAVQQALIEHCELMKYRFAVLDAKGPPEDDLGSVRDLRSLYDSKYAAIYHPWVQIPNPFRGATEPSEVACPPSGHVLGLIADVDVRRGVHKAPANEVLRGVVGLQRKLQKAEQELLNPFPSNLNVIRDFRDENRGIRVWGARVITSDPDWKYINVRRLFNFVEKSVERGLQWVVFEPNDEPLWARVRQSISAFLKTVWRGGALQGRTQEEAFYVVADRTTMTQQDIDNGRLIVEVGIAPVKPAEFVIIRIGMYTANAES